MCRIFDGIVAKLDASLPNIPETGLANPQRRLQSYAQMADFLLRMTVEHEQPSSSYNRTDRGFWEPRRSQTGLIAPW